jgi:hypothetical protein
MEKFSTIKLNFPNSESEQTLQINPPSYNIDLKIDPIDEESGIFNDLFVLFHLQKM